MPAPSEEDFRAVSSDTSFRFAVSGHRSDCTTTYKSRNQSREAGTSSRIVTAWKLLPNISHWVLQTIEKRYQIQFGSRPPRFMGLFSTEVAPQRVLVMEQEVKALLEKGDIEYVPHSNKETRFYSWYIIVPKKNGGCVPF